MPKRWLHSMHLDVGDLEAAQHAFRQLSRHDSFGFELEACEKQDHRNRLDSAAIIELSTSHSPNFLTAGFTRKSRSKHHIRYVLDDGTPILCANKLLSHSPNASRGVSTSQKPKADLRTTPETPGEIAADAVGVIVPLAIISSTDHIAQAGFWCDALGLYVTAANPVELDLGFEATSDAKDTNSKSARSYLRFRKRDEVPNRSLVWLTIGVEAANPNDFAARVTELQDFGGCVIGPAHSQQAQNSNSVRFVQYMSDPMGWVFKVASFEVASKEALSGIGFRADPTPPPSPVTLKPRPNNKAPE